MIISDAFAVFEVEYLINEGRSEKTKSEYRGRIFGKNNGFISVIGDIPVSIIGVDHIITWKVHMREWGLKPSYINHQLSEFRMFLKWLGENEFRVIDWKTITFDKEPKGEPKTILTPEEVDRLVACATNLRDKAIIKLFFNTGMRSAELISIDRYEWEGAAIVNQKEILGGAEPLWELYVMGKNQKYRPILFHQEVKSIVDAYIETREDRFKPLFTSLQNRRIHWSTIGKMIHAASRRAGLEKVVTQHILRHSYATDRAVNGMPMPVLAYNLGHSNSSTTAKIYTHVNALHARGAYVRSYPERVVMK